jgi:RNA polymerase sigma factor (sigma-70 family)
MAGARLDTLLRQLRRVAGPPGNGEATDSRLLERWLSQRDEAAFELLVRRHGPLVWGVCRRVLADPHEAEDCFQASFLALLKKAGSIGRREAVGGWLYKVAYRTALRARAGASRRAGPPLAVAQEPAAWGEDPGWRDLRPVLDEEVSRLPERLRLAFVLCCLEGKTLAEAAGEIGCPAGTVSSRLTRARKRLRARLTLRGLAPGCAGLAAVLLPHTAPAAAPAALVARTVWTTLSTAAGAIPAHVAALTNGVLRAMLMTRLKIVAAVLLMAVTVAGLGVLGYQASAAGPDRGSAAGTPDVAADEEAHTQAVEDLGKENLRFSQEVADRARPGLIAIAAPPAAGIAELYRLAAAGQVPRELVGRLPGVRSVSDRLEVISFRREGGRITAEVKHIFMEVQHHVDQVFYVRAKLPPLPPGHYSVTIRFRNYHQEGERVVAAPAAEAPVFPPLSCAFTVPGTARGEATRPAPAGEVARKLLRVPSPTAGILVFIGTEVKPGEKIPAASVVSCKVGKKEWTYRPLREGDRVERGQMLAVLDDTLVRLELAGEEAKRTAAEADLQASKATYEEAQHKLDRLDNLKRRNAASVTAEEYFQAVLIRDRYRQEVVSKEQGVKLAEANLEKVQAVLAQYQVRSPARGTVTALYHYKGEAVRQYEPILQIRLADKED